jgi:hypothetical protein
MANAFQRTAFQNNAFQHGLLRQATDWFIRVLRRARR